MGKPSCVLSHIHVTTAVLLESLFRRKISDHLIQHTRGTNVHLPALLLACGQRRLAIWPLFRVSGANCRSPVC
ncbi:hypothetical protein CEXT_309301 [Caerostris extrusa]|uniref:Secreted protein n=1 Tax=Caerostris extrusa TaxID=172846 RepID=A0AAV4R2R4_CAEEX|nr:hypothetical protein CEXT_309301 [Caerostris extrusa]